MPITPQEMLLFRSYAEKMCGLQLSADKTYLIESRIAPLVAQIGAKDFGDFYRQAQNDRSGKLRDLIIDALTTHETYWFRDERPWTAFRDEILPKLAEELRSGRRTRARIWSAACSSGQEPYTIAMIIDERCTSGALPSVRPEQFEIVATDISPGTLAQAKKGVFTHHEISRGLSETLRTRYFTASGLNWEINASLRARVQFRQGNLLEDFNSLGLFDTIFCRNVAIYFSDEVKRSLFARLTRALSGNGYLLIGATESLLGMNDAFTTHHTHGALYYQKK